MLVIFFAAVLVTAAQSSPPASDLKALYEAHDWFRLRAAVDTHNASALYTGAVEAAFNQVSEAEKDLRSAIEDSSDADAAADAASFLSYLFLRNGRYREAASELAESPLSSLLQLFPDQSVSVAQPSKLKGHITRNQLWIPLASHDKSANFFVDSDANISFMSESQAKNWGLSIQGEGAEVHGAGGSETSLRMALVDELTIGAVTLKNVAFIVLPDTQDVFARMPLGSQGALGLPVLIALRRFEFTRTGDVAIGNTSTPLQDAEQNLCFDGMDPVTLFGYSERNLPAVLDTGAAVTELWPPFAKVFPDVANGAGKMGAKVEAGVAAQVTVPEKIVSALDVHVGGRELNLHPAHLLLAPTTPNSRRYYGRLGFDALMSADRVIIDFASLQLKLE
jgi:predicted aspartyl protease